MTVQNIEKFESRFNEIVCRLTSNQSLNVLSIKASCSSKLFFHNFSNGIELNNTRSISKVIVSLCFGILLNESEYNFNQSKISIHSKITELLRSNELLYDLLKNKFKDVEIFHLLTNTIGYDKELLFSKDISNDEHDKLLIILLSEELVHKPGSFFVYSNASSYLLSVVFKEYTGINISDFANRYLFSKLGIINYKWGNYGSYCMGATGLYLDIHSLYKIGKLILNDGSWQNKQIISKKWVEQMYFPHITNLNKEYTNDPFCRRAYGLSLWISNSNEFFINGNMGQFVIISKDKDIVVSIFANTNDTIILGSHLKYLIS